MPALIDGEAEVAELRQRLDGEGVAVTELEVVVLTAELDVESCRRALEIGQALGVQWLVVCGDDADRGRCAAKLSALTALANAHGIDVVLEFVPYTQVRTLADAVDLVRASGGDAQILVDAYHLNRSGGTASEIAALPASLFPYIQISDGLRQPPKSLEATRREAREARTAPGEGEFDLANLIAAAPAHAPLSLEVPNLVRIEQMGALPYAKSLRAAAERLLRPSRTIRG